MTLDYLESTRLSSNKFNLYLPPYKTNTLQKVSNIKLLTYGISDHLRQNISFNLFKKEFKKIFYWSLLSISFTMILILKIYIEYGKKFKSQAKLKMKLKSSRQI